MSNETPSETYLEDTAPYFSRSMGMAWKAQIACSPRVLANWYLYLPERKCPYTCFFFTLHHLRDVEGELQQVKYFNQATHGVLLLAVENNQRVQVDKLPIMAEKAMFAGQWYCAKDEIAINLVTETVDDMCRGRLDPVDQEKDEWVMRFGDNVADRENLRTSYILPNEDIN